MKTAIVTDSNSGVTQIEAQKMNVFVLPMPVIIEGQAYYEGIDLLPDQFFRALTERQAVSTSQPSPGDVTALWDKVLTEYDELVYIPMSSGLSASCATAQMLAEDYEGRVFVVDNHRISISQKSSTWDAVALREAGCGAQEIQRELEASGLDSIVYVGVETLEYLRRGGRVTAGAAAIGAVLQIKPLLKIEGELLDACAKVRGTAGCKKKAAGDHSWRRGAAFRQVGHRHRRGRQLSGRRRTGGLAGDGDERVPGARRHLRRSAFLQRQQPCGAGRLRYGCEPPPGPDEGRDLIR